MFKKKKMPKLKEEPKETYIGENVAMIYVFYHIDIFLFQNFRIAILCSTIPHFGTHQKQSGFCWY